MRPEDYRWYYFGCLQYIGHHLYDKRKYSRHVSELIELDGLLCPKDTTPYRALLTRIPHLEYTALAWWDHTVDRRGGSNSIIFAPSPSCSLESIRSAMSRWFPWVEARLPQPLFILDGEQIYDPVKSRGR